ncbi:hypothetical protein EN866_33840 [Mesorhizobium sp. M2D.F.Ca.ET.223.01.1.1]|uniref:hypothetical protein n=1 Tax=Mesorhizobium sp. M2D.F.Ca.ET.223.01.1.1 TaxID=2563940 RepID=UPI001093164C|nr:hypothetical protein [Mesorhizobium sp. M2D.F.Ca.ET.223.01.1.1]TGR83610.1 hypothetical protein EN866_33840 [Mesorhizobium sp. M2D.F.Ca.ET.223.01.1.1]TGT74566.1 hypothetical protein EN802_12025 [bacterium M00.F.Ca.ET.159.01.1.1]TGT86816.1 hypothetical protein EN800_08915 [bacterium M00.F.Ca.ET.157.01.1.1]
MAKPYIDEHGVFSMPVLVHSMDDVPDDCKEAYQVHPKYPDRFILTGEGRELKAWYEGEMKRLSDQIESLSARHAKAEQDKATVERSLTAEVAKAGIKQGLQEGVVALIQERNKFVVQPSDDGTGAIVIAASAYGGFPVDRVVASFLESDDGVGYRQAKRGAPTVGKFTQMIQKVAAGQQRGR